MTHNELQEEERFSTRFRSEEHRESELPKRRSRRRSTLLKILSVVAAACVSSSGQHAVSSQPARANADPQGESELRSIFGAIAAAILSHDPSVIEKYYSPDYVMTFADGRRGGFENSLHTLADENRNQWRKHDRSNEQFLFYGDTAIALFTVHSQWLARASQRQFDVREHVTQTWIRRSGRWTLVATHVSSIDPSQQ